MMVVGSIDDSEDAKKIKVETSVRCHKFDPLEVAQMAKNLNMLRHESMGFFIHKKYNKENVFQFNGWKPWKFMAKWLYNQFKSFTGVIILPTQTMHYLREIPQN